MVWFGLDWIYLCLMLPVLGPNLFASPSYLDTWIVSLLDPCLDSSLSLSLTNYLRLTSCALKSASLCGPEIYWNRDFVYLMLLAHCYVLLPV